MVRRPVTQDSPCAILKPEPMNRTAVLYARVSSKDQEREGFSIPAQLDLLRSYAASRGLTTAQEFVDVETAKQAGRAAFGQMVAFAKKHRGRLVILVEKTDRLYRNLRDWVTLEELDAEIHLVKENVVLSPESRSHEKFMHGIKVLMAKNYVENLGEETKKGMAAKAKQGIWPSFAPPGYRNVAGPDGKRTIEPDPIDGPIITRLFERFAKGDVSIKMVAREFTTVRGRRLYPSQIHQALRKRIYMGDFDFDGTTYSGTHAPIVDRETWERVQSAALCRMRHNRRSCAKLCHSGGGELDQIHFLLGHVSVQTTERYLGCKQRIRGAVNDHIGIEP
jgi:site-specific DNA recombinase